LTTDGIPARSGIVSSAIPKVRAVSWPPVLIIGAVSIVLGYAVVHGEWKAPVGLAIVLAAAAIMVSGRLGVLVLLTAAVFYQAPLANVASFPGVTLAEIVTPIAIGVLLLGTRSQSEGHVRWHGIDKAVAVYSGVLAFNLLRSKYLLAATIPNGINRAFYDYAVAIGVYAAVRVTFSRRDIRTDELIRLLYPLCVAAAAAGVAVVLLHLPVNLGDLRYSVYRYSTGAVRVGFLEAFGAVGAAIALTRPVRYRLPALALFAVALVVSGGRSTVAGVAVSAVVYLAIVTRKTVGAIGAGALVAAFAAVALIWAWPAIRNQPQVQRLSNVNASSFNADGRSFIYSQSLVGFKSNPVFGTGVGVPSYVVAPGSQADIPGVTDFYRAQLEVGGHTTYASLLKNTGLAGLLPFVAALMMALIAAARARSSVGAFFFVALGTEAVSMFAAGNGSDPLYYFLLAACAAWLAGEAEPTEVGSIHSSRTA
jgi:O-antigen ligase/polysaccharide polymerase Wzy-like membrane protein